MNSGLFCLIFSLLCTFSIADAKFSRGDQFQYSNIEGALTIVCNGRTKTVTCRDVFMDPWPYDVFLGPRSAHADNVSFQATNGRDIQNSTAKYDGQTGRSADVNLGVFSIFQKPLLRVGENQVRYSILDKTGNTLDSEVFVVNVTRGKSRTCVARETISDNADDCDHSYSLCQLYFTNQNFCH